MAQYQILIKLVSSFKQNKDILVANYAILFKLQYICKENCTVKDKDKEVNFIGFKAGSKLQNALEFADCKDLYDQ